MMPTCGRKVSCTRFKFVTGLRANSPKARTILPIFGISPAISKIRYLKPWSICLH